MSHDGEGNCMTGMSRAQNVQAVVDSQLATATKNRYITVINKVKHQPTFSVTTYLL